MISFTPTGQILGATVTGIDISRPLSDEDFAAILLGLGTHGVLRFPGQRLQAVNLRDFAQRFGRIQATLTSSLPKRAAKSFNCRGERSCPGKRRTPRCPRA